MEKIKFYDTCALLNIDIEKIEDKIYLSSVTLNEIEHIKTSKSKDDDVKFKARKITRWLKDNEEKYECIVADKDIYELVEDFNLEISNDNLIIATAYDLQDDCHDLTREVEFYTNDICCYNIAKNVFNLKCNTVNSENIEKYKGYVEMIMTDEEMAKFYESEIKNNIYDLKINQYLVIKNTLNQPVDAYRCIGDTLIELDVKPIRSNLLGKLKAKDFYQQCALDSMYNNTITMIKGKAGSGKSHLAINFLLSQLEKGKIDKIIMFINDVPVRGANLHGFLPGSLHEKLLDSQIGSFLLGKLGDKMQVTTLISMGTLVLLPLSDLRGFDTNGMNAGIYITESQNLNIGMMKLAIQRIGEDGICIIDGDCDTQVDNRMYEGSNNGMNRLSEVFRGEDLYGEIELNTCYRSKLAKIAEKM